MRNYRRYKLLLNNGRRQDPGRELNKKKTKVLDILHKFFGKRLNRITNENKKKVK